jgi:hypothetical protein
MTSSRLGCSTRGGGARDGSRPGVRCCRRCWTARTRMRRTSWRCSTSSRARTRAGIDGLIVGLGLLPGADRRHRGLRRPRRDRPDLLRPPVLPRARQGRHEGVPAAARREGPQGLRPRAQDGPAADDSLSSSFEPERYHDEYREKVLGLEPGLRAARRRRRSHKTAILRGFCIHRTQKLLDSWRNPCFRSVSFRQLKTGPHVYSLWTR